MKDKIIFLAVVFFFNTSISSNETEVGQCRVIEDPAARLVCYDSFFQSQPDESNIAKKNTSSPNINSLEKNITPPKKPKLTQIETNRISKSINEIKQFGLPKKESEKPIAVQAKITKINKLGSFKQSHILQHFSSSTRKTDFCTAYISKFSDFRTFLLMFADFFQNVAENSLKSQIFP